MDEIGTIGAGVVGGAAEVAICGGRSSRHGGYDCDLCVVGEKRE